MKSTRKIIKIDEEKCNGCGVCVPSCAEGAIKIIDGKARLVAEKFCDGLGPAWANARRGRSRSWTPRRRPSMRRQRWRMSRHRHASTGVHVGHAHAAAPKPAAPAEKALPCGCPSSVIQTFAPQTACERANTPVSRPGSGVSALTHWPIQIHLVPPTAPFLRGADLLVAADCTPAAYHRFHDDLLRGKTVLMGCPKFDDAEAYINKFAAIFSRRTSRALR